MIHLDEPVDLRPIVIDQNPPELHDEVDVVGWPAGVECAEVVRTFLIQPEVCRFGRICATEMCAANVAEPHTAKGGYSGGPVIRMHDGQPRLLGLYSRHTPFGVDEGGTPMIFTDITSHRDFIDKFVRVSGESVDDAGWRDGVPALASTEADKRI